MKLEHGSARDVSEEHPIVLDPEQAAAHALRNILTIASFYETSDDARETLAAIRELARRGLRPAS